jgi:thymidine kinase
MASLTVIMGPMYAEKSATLISFLTRHALAKRRTVVFRGRAATRSRPATVESRNGLSLEAIEVDSGQEMMSELGRLAEAGGEPVSVVGVDEAQFVKGLVCACDELLRRGLRVYVSTLNGTFARKAWPETGELLALGAKVISLEAVCARCGAFSASTSRLCSPEAGCEDAAWGAKPLVAPATEEAAMYEPLCLPCWYARAWSSGAKRL